ncbi:YHYH domain-containing protein [Rhizobium leguminosarum]
MGTQPMNFVRIALAAAVFAFSAISASGHGGGLDKNGCHTNHKTGDYHCH